MTNSQLRTLKVVRANMRIALPALDIPEIRFLERMGLVRISLNFISITGRGRQYLRVSQFERTVMEARWRQ